MYNICYMHFLCLYKCENYMYFAYFRRLVKTLTLCDVYCFTSNTCNSLFIFFIGQSRIDGAFCDFTEQHRADHLKKLNAAGVDNIEMECTAIASLCHRAGVRAAIVCVALLDRLEGTDQVVITPEDYADYASRPQKLISRYIKNPA